MDNLMLENTSIQRPAECNIRLISTSLRNSPVLAVQEKQKWQSNVSHSSLEDGINILAWNWTLVTLVRIVP